MYYYVLCKADNRLSMPILGDNRLSMPILGEMSSVHGMFRELEEEVYLPKDEYERVMVGTVSSNS